MVQILWTFGMVLGTMGLEIATFITWTPPIMYACDLLPHNGDTGKKIFEVYQWIMNGHKQSFGDELKLTTKQDRIIRTCIVNKELERHTWPIDCKFKQFIDEQEKTSFMNVISWSILRERCTQKGLYRKTLDWSNFHQVFLALLTMAHIIAHNEVESVRGETKKKILAYGVSFAILALLRFIICPEYLICFFRF